MNLYDLLNEKKRKELLSEVEQLEDGEKIYAKMLMRAITHRLKNYGIDAYRPYPRQKEFHTAPQFFRIMWGSNSSGKTYCGVAEACMHVSNIYPDWFPERNRYPNPVSVWIALEDYDSFEDTHKPYIEKFVGPMIKSYNSQKHIMTFKNGKKIHVKSYRSGVDAFKSSEIPFIYLDEEPTEAILDACRARIVRRRKGQIIATITPISGPQWFFKILEQAKNNDDYFQVQVSMDDNESLTEQDKKQFKEGIDDERERRVRVEGEAVPLIGQRVFKEEPLENLKEDVREPKTARLTWRDEPEEEEPYELKLLNPSA